MIAKIFFSLAFFFLWPISFCFSFLLVLDAWPELKASESIEKGFTYALLTFFFLTCLCADLGFISWLWGA